MMCKLKLEWVAVDSSYCEQRSVSLSLALYPSLSPSLPSLALMGPGLLSRLASDWFTAGPK